MKQCFKNFDKEEFRRDVSNTSWENVITDDENVNTALDKFINELEKVIDKHAPFKKLNKKQMSALQKPWVTKGIIKAINIKNNIHKKIIKANNPTLKNNLHNQFKKYRNIISNLLKKSKQNYYINFFNENLNNIKGTWKGIKELINFKTNKSSPPTELEIEGKLETDPKTVSDFFNQYFSTIQVKPAKQNYSHYLNSPNPNSFYIDPVTKEETFDFIKTTLKPGKSTGPNSLPSSLLLTISDLNSSDTKSVCICVCVIMCICVYIFVYI